MGKFWWRAAWGICLLQLSLAQQIDLNVTCRFAGVFHVEKNGRYSISRTEAADLCKAFNTTLPTMAQMQNALEAGFETCRYGFIEGHVVIPRIHPNSICAANNTGVYILTSNTSQYDTYCFNASAAEMKEDCASITDLPNSFEGPVSITIVNRDGTRYTKTGEYRTNPNDINPSSAPEEDMSSGSSSERSTSGGYIFNTHLPTTAHPIYDQEDYGVSESPEGSPVTTQATPSSTIEETATQKEQWFGTAWHGEYPQVPKEDSDSAAGTPATSAHESHPSQRMTTQSQEDSSWNNFFNSVSHPMGEGHQTQGNMDMDTSDSTTLPPSEDQNTGWVEDLERPGPFSITTQQSHMQSFSTLQGDLEEDNDHPMTSTPTSSNRNDGTVEGNGGSHPEDSTTSVEGSTSHSSDTKDIRTHIPVTPLYTGAPGVTEVTVVGDSNFNVDRSLPEDQDSVFEPSGDSHTTHGSESAGHSSGSRDGGLNTTSGPMRRPQIPEWLIILASLLALALILAVCIAVNSRRRCGQKKKLVINNGNGAVEARKPSGLNGEASKSQEMVHLVNKEPTDTPDQIMTADETRNLQNVDMKIGV
ncbi:CD44 antigen isoform X3 [Talpa occidentalis]|uniref:CD44 antigen isoform X3 n=1 Tax=Talpa occidentalis TaxID=50954 RepID=UPI00188DF028|nr:CD44 antigen isoform X3 [Talpa occidentalis]